MFYKDATLNLRKLIDQGASGVELAEEVKSQIKKTSGLASKYYQSIPDPGEGQEEDRQKRIEREIRTRYETEYKKSSDYLLAKEELMASLGEKDTSVGAGLDNKNIFVAPNVNMTEEEKKLQKEFSKRFTKGLGSRPEATDMGDIGVNIKRDLEEIFGLTDFQAAAIAGNLAHETGDFKFMQELDPVVPGSKGGYGFAQWTGPRRKAFMEWSEQNELNPNSYEANLGFLVHEFQTDKYFQKVLQDLEQTNSVEEATKVFSEGYLKPGKPNMDSRIKRSKNYIGN